MKNISTETKILAAIIIGTIVLIGGAIVVFSNQQTQTETTYTREELIPEDTPLRGNASASAYLVEFSDYQCPACGAYEPLVEDVMKQYGDKLTLAYRNFPLSQHEFAMEAAQAALAAKKQDKFWEYHDLLFANQDKFSSQEFTDLANQLELNMEQFKQDKDSQEVKDRIQKDVTAATTLHINATPTFFLNGKKLTPHSGQDFINLIEQAVK